MTDRVSRFAENTDVPVSKTKTELDLLLAKHGALQRGVYEETGRGVVMFTMAGRQIKLKIALPLPSAYLKPSKEPTGWHKWKRERQLEWARLQAEQAQRSAWRRLLLVTRAKLELVLDTGGNIEAEFLAHILLPDGRTVHEALEPQLAESYAEGRMPPLLGAG